jgi:hypothetical protein
MEWYSNARQNLAGILLIAVSQFFIGDEGISCFIPQFAIQLLSLWNYTPPQSAAGPSPFGNVGLGAEQSAPVLNPPCTLSVS